MAGLGKEKKSQKWVIQPDFTRRTKEREEIKKNLVNFEEAMKRLNNLIIKKNNLFTDAQQD